MHPYVNIAVKAARQAGEFIVKACSRIEHIDKVEKQPSDFVTEVDQQAEQIIIRTIRQAYPSHGILAEESGHSDGDNVQWIIDPLDGTTNFIHGFPHYAISIAIRCDNKIEHGVIYDPQRQELFFATRGRGAQLNNQRIRVSSQRDLKGALLGTGFPFRHKQHLDFYLKTFTDFFQDAAGIRRAGSAALDLAYVAAGRLDGFWEIGLNEWDIAAGTLLVKEAGGLISGFDGSENYLNTGHILAGNPKILKTLLKTIHPHYQAWRG